MRALTELLSDLEERDLLDLAKSIAQQHNVRLEEMFSSRMRPAARARHAFWAELVEHEHMSLVFVGRLCGADHATVLAGVRRHRVRAAIAEDEGEAYNDRLSALELRVDTLERELTDRRAPSSARRIA